MLLTPTASPKPTGNSDNKTRLFDINYCKYLFDIVFTEIIIIITTTTTIMIIITI